MPRSLLFVTAACSTLIACGGSPSAPPAAPAPGSAAQASAAGAHPSDPATKSAPAPAAEPALAAAAPASADAYDDPEEHDPAKLVPLFGRANRPHFPKATLGERECWETVPITGVARNDFDALIARCGTPTGAVEYAKPRAGKLHHVKDKRDTYVVRIQGGLCYRFFGVADGTIENLDIVIERANGALVGEDRTHGPVAIIDSDKLWCMDRDDDYQFNVQVGGTGTGNYVFGVWARADK
jgi:hypothetical protein